MENRPNPQIPINSIDSYPNASKAKNVDANKPKTKPKSEAIIQKDHVTVKKQSAWQKAKRRIFEEEGKELKGYIIDDVLIPSIKEVISNIVSNGVDILLYGEVKHIGQRKPTIFGGTSRFGNYINYGSTASRPSIINNRNGVAPDSTVRRNLSLDDFLFDTKKDANDILDTMSTILIDYGIVTVADLYDLCGLSTPYTYNNYGWKDLSTAGVSLTPSGYLLNLPTPQLLN